MKRSFMPGPGEWNRLVQRPSFDNSAIENRVKEILEQVRTGGDSALVHYNTLFDGYSSSVLQVTRDEIARSSSEVSPGLKRAIGLAASNIDKFHRSQLYQSSKVETSPGVFCWTETRPIESVGIYIPGGTAPLFSTVLMLGIPARIAGCREVILCTPPGPKGEIDPAILYTADLCGISKVFRAGGAQAVAALAYGTASIPKVDKIFGPGNRYVTKAKELVQLDGVAIDMPAGPSELLVIADSASDPSYVAADLLSQAEHGTDSQVILLADQNATIEAVLKELEIQLALLPRKEIAAKALSSSHAIVLSSLEECISFSNTYAPEHLILATDNFSELLPKVSSAGSVFLGRYSCESAGDYASGTNHTLPTGGYARAGGGLTTGSFMKRITIQEVTAGGLEAIGPAIETMARAEGLDAHKNAVTIRLKK